MASNLDIATANDKLLFTPGPFSARLTPIERKLRHAGAHYVVESIADVPAVLEDIQARLRQGEQP